MKTTLLLLALLLCAAPSAAQTAEPNVEIIAHRGESADAPENTMAAFRLAWQRNDPAIELDVHLTKDGRLIVSHDANTKRTTGVDRIIEESTLEELRALDAGSWKGAQWAGEKLPTLEEVLAELPDGKKCIIEIKAGPEVVPAVARAVRESGLPPEQLAVISFNLDAVAESKRQLPDIEAYYLASFKQDEATGAWTPTIDTLIARAQSAGVDGLDLAYR
ncbi:MAG TPA: glycerophosphodiester phosphodiesterase family protein, partial [Rhodothermales bacterium]|nr:glycerophosphodiester phosphodiesterase family protein [Rhodothermales bacterium]